MREIDSDRVIAKASGTASTKASAMPAVAMASVSSVALRQQAEEIRRDSAGGRKPARKPPITRRLCRVEQRQRLELGDHQHRPQHDQREQQRAEAPARQRIARRRAGAAQRSSAGADGTGRRAAAGDVEAPLRLRRQHAAFGRVELLQHRAA